MKIKRLMIWISHNDYIQELMSRNKNSSLFKVLRFVRKLGTKLWVWHDQHICYTKQEVNMAIDSYHTWKQRDEKTLVCYKVSGLKCQSPHNKMCRCHASSNERHWGWST
jgi:hypothetical protein